MTLLTVLQGNYVQMSISDIVINYFQQIVGIPEPNIRGSFHVCSLGLFSFVKSSLEESETFRISGIQDSLWLAGLAFHQRLLARHCRRCRRRARDEIHHSAFAAAAGRG